MALTDLIEVLRREAEAEAAAILAAAEAEAEAIRKRTAADLAARRAALEAELDEARRSAVELALSTARLGARRGVLEARERLLDRVFQAARAGFAEALEREEYHQALPDQLAEALGCLGDRPGTLRCHPAVHRPIEELLGARRGIRLLPDASAGAGFRLASDDGAVEIDATLEDRLIRLETRVRQEVLARLEAGP
jgi:vacuolar-type H+-ATPase subunit E/Vma4